MTSSFVLSTFLRQTPKGLLKRYFDARGLLGDVAFDLLHKREFQPILDAIEALPDEKRAEVDGDFQEVDALADAAGTRVIVDLLTLNKMEVVDEVGGLENGYARAMWLFLEQNASLGDLFSQCSDVQRTDRLRFTRSKRRNHLPRKQPVHDDAARGALAEGLKGLYRRQGRGHHCYVVSYRRPDPDRHYFVAYPEDFPRTDLQYEGEDLRRLHRRPVLDVAFIFRPDEGVLEMHAPGKRDEVNELQNLFCTAILGEPPPTPYTSDRSFKLGSLLDRQFCFPVEVVDGIEAVDVTEMVVHRGLAMRPRLTFETEPCPLPAFLDQLAAWVKVPLAELTITAVRLRVRFPAKGEARAKTVTFSVSLPDTTDLKDTPEHTRIKRLLREWGLAA
jgi:hypothetical protein